MTSADRIAVDVLATQIAAASPDLDPGLQRAALTLLGLLARGEPVGLERLAEALSLPAASLDEALEGAPGVFRDERRQVTGFMGLSITEVSDHRVRIDGRTLWARCAWDTLFLPELLGAAAAVSSRCPSSGQGISLTVTPAGVAGLAPPETVISFLAPEGEFGADVVQSFCHFVHFFASPEAGESWNAEHAGTFVLSVDEAYHLGQLTNRAGFGAALG